MLLHPFVRFTCCYTLFGQFACFTPIPDSFSLHVITPFYDKLANLHTATSSATIRPKYPMILLLLFFLLASFYNASPPSYNLCHFYIQQHCCFVKISTIFEKLLYALFVPQEPLHHYLNSTSAAFQWFDHRKESTYALLVISSFLMFGSHLSLLQPLHVD
jgi:hypothetical protein